MAFYNLNYFAIFSVFVIAVINLVNVSGSTVFEDEERNTRMTHWEQCETSDDCSEDECCVSLRKSVITICKKRSKLGNLCRPALMPGIKYSCPCSMGLTCALTAMDNYGRREKYQCVLVPEEDLEYEAREN